MEKLLEKLTSAYGPSGSEEGIREAIKEEIKGYVDHLDVDRLGNLIAVKKGKGKKIMLAAHMDELGLIVTDIDEKGFLRFSNVGGISPYSLPGQRVVFLNGVVGVVEAEKVEDIRKISFDKLFIDIGVENKEEAKEKVRIGDIAVYKQDLIHQGSRFVGKSLDDRAGCAVLVQAVKELQNSPLEIYFIFTVQEELGLRGARTAAYSLEPDFAIAIDVTRVGDTPEPPFKMAVSLGQGPTVKIMDSSIISHPIVREKMISIAEKNDIPYQLEVLERGGTDAGAIHMSREGVPSGVMSIPCRYVHSSSEMVDKNDMEQGVKLLLALLADSWN